MTRVILIVISVLVIFLFSLSNDFRRNSAYNREIRNIFGHYSSRSNNRTFPDLYAWKNNRSTANPRIFADFRRCSFTAEIDIVVIMI